MDLKKLKTFYYSLNCFFRRTYIVLSLLVISIAIVNIFMIALSNSKDIIFVLGIVDVVLLIVSMIIYPFIIIKAIEFRKGI